MIMRRLRKEMGKKFGTMYQKNALRMTDFKIKICKTTFRKGLIMGRYRVQSVVRFTMSTRHLLKERANTSRSMEHRLMDDYSRDLMLILARTSVRSQNERA